MSLRNEIAGLNWARLEDGAAALHDAADIADAILQIAPRLVANPEPSLWGTYHLTGAHETTWHGFAAEIFRREAINVRTTLGFVRFTESPVEEVLHAIDIY